MNRRAFLGSLTGGLLAAPLAAEAQQPRVYRVGVIVQGGPYLGAVDGLRKGLAEMGFEEGKQFILHVRDGSGDLKVVEQAAGDLERENVDLIYSLGTRVTLVVKRATKTVPIVFNAGNDPVSGGLVESFRKPGRRLTGTFSRSAELTGKRLELLKEMVPRLRRVVTFYNPTNLTTQLGVKIARDAARRLKMELVEHRVGSVEELRAGVRALRAGEADAYCALPGASYGVSYFAIGQLSARYVHQILLGVNPGDLPIEQFDRLYFVINLKTAKALGLTIPPSLLQRADQVIE